MCVYMTCNGCKNETGATTSVNPDLSIVETEYADKFTFSHEPKVQQSTLQLNLDNYDIISSMELGLTVRVRVWSGYD